MAAELETAFQPGDRRPPLLSPRTVESHLKKVFTKLGISSRMTQPITPTTESHYMSGHREFDGIIAPTVRRIYPIDEDGSVQKDQLIISIDLDGSRFE